MNTTVKALFSLGILASMNACGGDGDSDTFSKPSTAFNALMGGFCSKAIECKDTAPDGVPAFDSVSQCVTLLQAQLGIDLDAIDDSASAGRVSWNADDAAYCFGDADDTIQAATCEQFWDEGFDFLSNDDARCEALGQGTVEDGDACTIDDDCASETSECADSVCAPTDDQT